MCVSSRYYKSEQGKQGIMRINAGVWCALPATTSKLFTFPSISSIFSLPACLACRRPASCSAPLHVCSRAKGACKRQLKRHNTSSRHTSIERSVPDIPFTSSISMHFCETRRGRGQRYITKNSKAQLYTESLSFRQQQPDTFTQHTKCPPTSLPNPMHTTNERLVRRTP